MCFFSRRKIWKKNEKKKWKRKEKKKKRKKEKSRKKKRKEQKIIQFLVFKKNKKTIRFQRLKRKGWMILCDSILMEAEQAELGVFISFISFIYSFYLFVYLFFLFIFCFFSILFFLFLFLFLFFSFSFFLFFFPQLKPLFF